MGNEVGEDGSGIYIEGVYDEITNLCSISYRQRMRQYRAEQTNLEL